MEGHRDDLHRGREERTAARKALDWCAERHGTLSAFVREQGRDLETLKRWVQRYYPDEFGNVCNKL